jgi:hypothetical protein
LRRHSRISETLKATDFEVSRLIIERDTCQYKKERIDELLNKIGEARGYVDAETKASVAPEAKNEPAAAQETTFTILKFEQQTGAKIGEYEVAYKASNIEDKWTHAYNVLRNSNATIKDRYHGEGYEFSYWLYGADKIYRQKLEPKA